MEPLLEPTLRGDRLELVAAGSWIGPHVAALERLVDAAATAAAPAHADVCW